MANAVPLAVRLLRQAAQASHRAGSAPGLLQAGEGGRPVRACGGHVAQRSRVRAGIRAQSISRGLSRQRPGQPGRRALKRGRWISQLRAHARPPPVGCGHHPASSGPRAVSATPTTLIPKALPRAALRTIFRTHRRLCRAAMRPAAMMGVPQPLFFGWRRACGDDFKFRRRRHGPKITKIRGPACRRRIRRGRMIGTASLAQAFSQWAQAK